MIRIAPLAPLALALAACAAEREPPVIRLDLERIAADTAERDRAPGFAALTPP